MLTATEKNTFYLVKRLNKGFITVEFYDSNGKCSLIVRKSSSTGLPTQWIVYGDSIKDVLDALKTELNLTSSVINGLKPEDFIEEGGRNV